MIDSSRELVLESYKTAFQNITVANGFNNTVTRVEREMLFWDDVSVTPPVLMVLGGNEDFTDQLGITTESRMKIKVRGYSRDTGDPEGAVNSLIRDVLALLGNKNYNTCYKSFRPISLDTDEGWLNTESDGLAMFELTFEILYVFRRDSP